MKKTRATLKNFIGTNYEIGQKIGRWMLEEPSLLQKTLLPPEAYPIQKLEEICTLLDQYCSGVNEEIQGFIDTLHVTKAQAIFYVMTYLERGCSLMAALPQKTQNDHTLMARNYDFNDEMEEMCFAYTEIPGKYRYIGSTLNLFGRCDGINEKGLAVCKASNGLPVGNFEGGQKAGVTGFSFWIVVRSILENCKSVEEALSWAMEAPIGYNINLMLADQSNKIALFECINGHKAFRLLDETNTQDYLMATNHTVLTELKGYEKMLIESSMTRYNAIEEMFLEHEKVTKEHMKDLLSMAYPKGLCCHYYPEFFGTLRSMVFDVTEGKIEMTFGSPRVNEWRSFTVAPLREQEITVMLPYEKADQAFYHILK